MPHSVVLNFLCEKPILPGYLEGRHLHALFLSMISAFDLELGTKLHTDSTHKAFALSPLQYRSPDHLQTQHTKAIPPETPCWWRIALLDDRLFGHLTPLWLNLNPRQSWHLGSTDLTITSVLGTPQFTQPWADDRSYPELCEQASSSERFLHFRFYTPTAFRQGKYDSSLPTPDLVFAGLINRWEKYSDIPLSPELKTIVHEHVFPCGFNLRTESIADRRSRFIGCLGTASYEILGQVEPNYIKQLNALANYATFCGVGRKTTMGMGMVRRNG
jgi:CRISPR-associated endoribonuclease Cas6